MTVSAKQDLPIKNIFINALKIILKNYWTLLYFGWPYVVLYFGIEVIDSPLANLPKILQTLIYLVIATIVIVHCHRIFLLPKNEVKKESVFRWGRRETKYATSVFVISMYNTAIFFVGYWLIKAAVGVFDSVEISEDMSFVARVLSFFLILYLWVRFMLILPDAAVGNIRPVSWAWEISSGKT